jgi:hypothetical protein
MARLLDPSLPVQVVRDAIADLAQIKQPKAEEALIALLQKLEYLLMRPEVSAQEEAKLKSILDRLLSALARYGTRQACRTVALHGLKRQPELGETLERLAYLAAQDLSGDEECVAQVVAALRDAMPRGLFRAVVPKDVGNLLHFIKALSSTPTPAVREVFRELADRFPDQEVGLAAAKALEEFDTARRPAEPAGGRLLGDLELFGLPDLLRQLAHSRATGSLTLQDQSGNAMGVLSLENGGMRSCRVGGLTGDDAVYCLLEKPIQGTFAFQGPGEAGPAIEAGGAPARELMPIITGGICRYDEYQMACALVPDRISLRPVGGRPAVKPEDEDPKFVEALWSKASRGLPPEECESGFAADPLRIRRLLARWVEEGLLVPS